MHEQHHKRTQDMKTGYEPGQRTGVNTFNHYGELITIIHPGAKVDQLHPGQILFLRRKDDLYWCGRVYNDVFIFLLDCAIAVPIEDAFDYLRAAWIMAEAHKEGEFVEQGELDF